MKIDKGIKSGILASLIATPLFLYLLKPIGTLTSRLFYLLFSNFHTSTINRFYRSAALGVPNDFGFQTYMVIYVLLVTGGFSFLLMTYLSRRPGRADEKEDIELINKNLDKLKKKIKILRACFATTLGIMTISMCFAYWSATFTRRAITSFNQYMTILAPHLPETEQMEIRGDWARMKGKSDYENIHKKLEEIASLNGIELPKNPIY